MVYSRRDLVRLNRFMIPIEYLVLIVYFSLLWAGVVTSPMGTAAEHIGGIVFVQFAGYFVTVMITFSTLETTDANAKMSAILALVVGGFGFVLMIALTDDLVIAGIWAISTLNGLLDDYGEVMGRAILRGGWVMLSGFLSAFVGSMAGVDPDTLLGTNLATVAGWGILYYAGLLLFTIIGRGSATEDDAAS